MDLRLLDILTGSPCVDPDEKGRRKVSRCSLRNYCIYGIIPKLTISIDMRLHGSPSAGCSEEP